VEPQEEELRAGPQPVERRPVASLPAVVLRRVVQPHQEPVPRRRSARALRAARVLGAV
jgi:hypothetical protein